MFGAFAYLIDYLHFADIFCTSLPKMWTQRRVVLNFELNSHFNPNTISINYFSLLSKNIDECHVLVSSLKFNFLIEKWIKKLMTKLWGKWRKLNKVAIGSEKGVLTNEQKMMFNGFFKASHYYTRNPIKNHFYRQFIVNSKCVFLWGREERMGEIVEKARSPEF